ncbi:uncharacterized protein LOC124449004 [Xenia sp. Carnegie-2017]|uniref:uncharacterized protein LOC124449004 n=1 Tax=Xenia sp. Carnegie-2017 TaxID=2897299 RepID=UPI001F0447A2|nr:uncharacterized protein LOC124449004 [Xenia sp. Carnegie-2017]
MNNRPQKYNKFSRQQIDALNYYFENGMKSTLCFELIKTAAEETLSVDKVKKWIGNKVASVKRKCQSNNSESPLPSCNPPKVPKPPPRLWGSHGYNLFSSEFFKSDEVKGLSHLSEKNKLTSVKWIGLEESEQNKYIQKANDMKNKPMTLDDAQRTKLVDQHMKLLAEELSYLKYLGCQASCLLVNGKKNFMSLVHLEEKDLFTMNQQFCASFKQCLVE